MKKFLFVFVTAIILCTALAVTSFAASVVKSGSCGTSVTYTLDSDGVLTISGSGAMENYSSNGSPWYSNSSVKKVVIEAGVESIGNYAFYSCYALESVTIPYGITSLGNSAFSLCRALKSVTIPDSVTSIGNYAFSYCYALKSVTIPDSVTSIGDYAFYSCSVLTSVTISNRLTSIGKNVFSSCKALESVTIPDSITSIENYAFYSCSALTSLTIPDSVTSIGAKAFEGCTALTNVTIGDNVTSIGFEAFKYCSAITSITLPFVGNTIDGTENTHFGYIFGASNNGSNGNYVPSALKNVVITNAVSIGKQAFDFCNKLTSVTIMDGVTSIGNSAFSCCYALKSVTIPDSVTSIGNSAFSSCGALENFVIPDSVTSIGDYAFSSCSVLTSVTISNRLTSIGKYVFSSCKALTSVTIPDSVTSIENSAFYYCSALTSLTIPDSVTSIGAKAFEGCTALTNVTIGDNVTSIDFEAFKDCSALTSITLPFVGNTIDGTENTHFGYIFGAPTTSSNSNCVPKTLTSVVVTNASSIGRDAFFSCSKLKSVTFLDGVTSIGSEAFSFCSSLESVTIPDSVTSIGNSAFEYCYALTSMTIPYGVTTIGERFFEKCIGLTSVFIPNSVTSVGNRAFAWCESLTSIIIPDSVTSIGSDAFLDCLSLADVNIGCNVTSIGSNALKNCTALTSITLPFVGNTIDGTTNTHFGYIFGASGYTYNDIIVPKTLKSVTITSATKINDNAFSYCENITSVTLSHTVTSIGKYAFSSCTSLESITVPNSVTSIGEYALGYYYGNNGYKRIAGFEINGDKDSVAETYAKDKGFIFNAVNVVPTVFGNGTVGTVNWIVYSNGVLTLSGKGEIPNYTRSATAPWTAYSKQIRKIVVENGITCIGNYAFYNLSEATSITVADSVDYLGLQFIRGTAIEEISVNAHTVAINAFGSAEHLKVVNFTENFKNPLGNIFYQETVTIKAPEKSFAHRYAEAFNGKFNTLATVSFESNGTTAKSPVARFGSMGDNVFYAMYENAKGNWKMVVSGTGVMKNFPYYSAKNEAKGYTFCPTYYMSKESVNTKIYAIEVLEGVTTVGNYAFYLCTKATEVNLPDGITSIGQGAFRTCAKLTGITLPESVTKIEANAFNGCTALTSVNIPDAVTTIGNDIFVKCNLANLSVTTTNPLAISYITSTYPEITVK